MDESPYFSSLIIWTSQDITYEPLCLNPAINRTGVPKKLHLKNFLKNLILLKTHNFFGQVIVCSFSLLKMKQQQQFT